MSESEQNENVEETESTDEVSEAVAPPGDDAAPEAEAAPEAAGEPEAPTGPAEALPPKERRRRERAEKAAAEPARPPRTPEERHQERLEQRRRKATVRRATRARARAKARARAHTAEVTPPREHAPGKQKSRQGVVVSDGADKTITVRIDLTRRHPRYEKIVRTTATLHAHDERNDAHVGDTVVVQESRPLSRTKRWRLVEILERAQ